jgi:hypothetical protein
MESYFDFSPLRRALRRLHPYASLVVVGLPVAVVWPLKMAALLLVGAGHWLVGAVALGVAYCTSIFCVERLFRFLRPNIMRLPWFAVAWTWLRETWVGRTVRRIKASVAAASKRLVSGRAG